MWFAKDYTGKYITIEQINECNKNNIYLCPVCGSEVIPKLGTINTHHFAHKDKTKCNAESLIHWCYKNNFLMAGTKFRVYDKETSTYIEHICKEINIEKTYDTSFGKYRPDVTVITTNNEEIFFEMFYSNQKNSNDYINIWCELNKPVVEIDIKSLLSYVNEIEYKFNPVFLNGICYKHKLNKNKSFQKVVAMKSALCNTINKTNEKRIIQLVNEIDWFWNDLTKYKAGQISIDEMSICLEYIITNADRNIVLLVEDILKNIRCLEVLTTYKKYCFEKYVDYNKHKILPLLNEKYSSLPDYLKWCKIYVDESSNFQHDYCYGQCYIALDNELDVVDRHHRVFDIATDHNYFLFDDCKLNEFVNSIIEYIKSEYYNIIYEYIYSMAKIKLSLDFRDVEFNFTTDTPSPCNFYLSAYNFNTVNNVLDETFAKIETLKEDECSNITNQIINAQMPISTVVNNYVDEIEIVDNHSINKIKTLLYPIFQCANKLKRDSVFILLNWKFFTNDVSTKRQLNTFVKNLRRLGINANTYCITKNN